MTRSVSVSTTRLGLLAVMLAVACREATTPPPPGIVPQLRSPSDGAVLPQNNATADCAADSAAGYGIRQVFVWARPGDPRVAGYLVFAKRAGSGAALILDAYTADTTYTHLSCGSYVADAFLDGWQWKVRSVLAGGAMSDYSTVRTWSYEPCRLSDGRPCFSPQLTTNVASPLHGSAKGRGQPGGEVTEIGTLSKSDEKRHLLIN